MALVVANAVLCGTASAQIAVELVPSIERPDAPVMMTLTASTPPDEPVLGYEWRGLGISPRCRARDCTIDMPVASCRRVEVSVIDRFGEATTVEQQICANDGGQPPPQATIEVTPGDPIQVNARADRGAAEVTVIRLWIDDSEVFLAGSIPQDRECHVVELLVADSEGRIGLDQRFVCNDPDAPRIAVGADPTFCPRAGEMLRACAEVIDPLGRGLDTIGGQPVPLDDCAELIPSTAVDRIVVRGQSEKPTHGSMISCTAPEGRPTLLFARLPPMVTVVRGESSTVQLSIDGGVGPFVIEGTLSGSSTIGISRMVEEETVNLALDVPGGGSWNELELEVLDSRGLTAEVTAPVTTKDPLPVPMGNAQAALGCSAVPLGPSAWLLLLPLLVIRGRRSFPTSDRRRR